MRRPQRGEASACFDRRPHARERRASRANGAAGQRAPVPACAGTEGRRGRHEHPLLGAGTAGAARGIGNNSTFGGAWLAEHAGADIIDEAGAERTRSGRERAIS